MMSEVRANMGTKGSALIFGTAADCVRPEVAEPVGDLFGARSVLRIAEALHAGGIGRIVQLGPIDDPAVLDRREGPIILTGEDARAAVRTIRAGSPVVLVSAGLVLLSADSVRAMLQSIVPGAAAVASEQLAAVRWASGCADDVLDAAASGRPVAQIVERVRAGGDRVETAVGVADEDLIALDSPAAYPTVARIARRRAVDRLVRSGVWVEDAERTYLDGGVTVAAGTLLLAGVRLRGPVAIGPGCTVGPDCTIEASTIESGCVVRSSVIEGARVRAGSRIGPYAHLRPGADVGPDARVGNYVEVKAARLERGVKAGHLAYIGDAEIGEGANIGAGAITCNFDGRSKYRTVIGAGAFIGSNAALVAPVTIGEGAVIAAGSTITEDVPPGTLAFGRARQVVVDRGREDEEEG